MERGYKIATRLGNKKDLCMFLALHMENSPMCVSPSEKFNKTGIVVCESDKIHKVVAMSCSRENLHAVQHVVLNVPCSLSNCTVYLSRKPCSTCTTFLIQGSVSSVYYWPMSPELKGEDSAVEEDLKQVDQMFLRSNISSSVFLPITDSDTVFKISSRIKIYKCTECSSHYAEAVPKDMEKNSSLLNMQGHIRICAEQMKNSLCCLDCLLHCPHGKFEKKEKIDVEKMHTHALQLCYLLAARSDDPDRGVGCVLYSQNGYFFGAGYNGYPIGAIFANLPCAGRDVKKESGTAKGPVLIHAEANALLFRSRKKIEENDILYCTKPPCSECQNYIQFVGIKKIVSVQESSQSSSNQQDSTGSLKSNFEYYQWKPQYAECSASPLSKQTENSEKRDGEETERKNDKGPPSRLPNKEDLCIFLALHMENSPNCQEPRCKYVGNKQKNSNILKFFKTGIVICEANKPKRIITMDCSTEDLHAVPKALLRFPNALRCCEVYLSRMPCISCAKLLIQAQISQVYYWPNLEIQITEVNLNKIEMEAEHVDNIFRESYITAAVYIPILNAEMVKRRIFPRIGSSPVEKGITPITSVCDHNLSLKLLEILNLAHIKKDKPFQESYKEDIAKAKESFRTLAGGIDTEIKENNFQEDKHTIQRQPKYTHALQLCNLLAARNDSPNTGVGTLIYRKEDIVAVGYNGFPKGTVNSLFAQKDDGSCDQHAIICAEANAIILRTEDDLSDTELITTCEPCSDCENLIKAMKIKKIIWPNRDVKKQPKGATNNPTEEENNPSTEPFQVKSSIKKHCDEKILALQADREKCNRKDTKGTSVSGGKEGKTMEIQSPADEGHASGEQAILNSSEASASHRDGIVKEDSEKTNPLLTETESELETESSDKPKESHNAEGPSVNAAEDEPV